MADVSKKPLKLDPSAATANAIGEFETTPDVDVIAVQHGGTGASTAEAARTNLGAATSDPFTGTTPGLVPDGSAAPAGSYLEEDGTWTVPPGSAVASVHGRTGAVVAATSDYDAVQVDVTPAGGIASTDVQAALEELDSEKAAAVHNHVKTDISDLNAVELDVDNQWTSPVVEKVLPVAGDKVLIEDSAIGGAKAFVQIANMPSGTPAADSITNVQLADMAAERVKGRSVGAGSGDPEDLTPAQLVAIVSQADGAGTGLDADLLDGNEATAFATAAQGSKADTALQDVIDDTTPQLGGHLDVNGQVLGDGTNALLGFVEDPSAVNYVEIENQATLGGPIIRSTGTDANVDLHLDTKGTGNVKVDDDLDVTGNITVTGTVDGRDVAADGAKLDGIESGATADQTAGEIEAIVNHDNLLGFVAAEHIDWSADGAEDVHVNRITSGAVTQHEGAIDHDALTNFVAAEHVDWASGSAGTVDISNLPVGAKGEQLTTNDGATALEFTLASKFLPARMASGSATKGQAVYVSGYNVGGWIEVGLADADAAGASPAVGLAYEALDTSTTSRVLMSGLLSGVATDSWSVGDVLYLSTTAGTLTNTRPTGLVAVQSVGRVARVHATLGEIVVDGAGRANDLPNIADAKFWVGDATSTATAVSMSGHATMDNAGVVTIDHDALTNFVAAEHVDWAGASAGTIHITNIEDASTTQQGVSEIATSAEIITGTDDTRTISPLGLRQSTANAGNIDLQASPPDALENYIPRLDTYGQIDHTFLNKGDVGDFERLPTYQYGQGHAGSGAPADGLGHPGDVYVDYATGDVYTKAVSAMTYTKTADNSAVTYTPADVTPVSLYHDASVFLPAGTIPTSGFPWVLYCNAGNFAQTQAGTTIASTDIPARFLDRGIAVVWISVTGIGTSTSNFFMEPGTSEFAGNTHFFPEKDAIWALQFFKHYAGTYNLDASRVGVYGVSSGAQTVGWGPLGVSEHAEFTSTDDLTDEQWDVQAAVLLEVPTWWDAYDSGAPTSIYQHFPNGSNVRATSMTDADNAVLKEASLDFRVRETGAKIQTTPVFIAYDELLQSEDFSRSGGDPAITPGDIDSGTALHSSWFGYTLAAGIATQATNKLDESVLYVQRGVQYPSGQHTAITQETAASPSVYDAAADFLAHHLNPGYWTNNNVTIPLSNMADLVQGRVLGRGAAAGTGPPTALTGNAILAISWADVAARSLVWTTAAATPIEFTPATNSLLGRGDDALGSTQLAAGQIAYRPEAATQLAATNIEDAIDDAVGTTGTGSFVRATSPTLVTPVLGTPTSGNLSGCTNLPLTGIADVTGPTALGRSTGTGAPIAMTSDQVLAVTWSGRSANQMVAKGHTSGLAEPFTLPDYGVPVKVPSDNVAGLVILRPDATVDPGATDDNTKGYFVGARWYNKTNQTMWVCASAGTGTATWDHIQSDWFTVTLGADFSLVTTSTDTFIDNGGGDNLSFSPGASKTYEIECRIFFASSVATTGSRPGIIFPTAGLDWNAFNADAPQTASGNVYKNWGPATDGSLASINTPSANDVYCGRIDGFIKTNGSIAGDFKATIGAENTSATITVKAGSFVRYRILP